MLTVRAEIVTIAVSTGWLLAPAASAGVGWDKDDFIVSAVRSDQIAVYDHDFSFKGYLDTDFPVVFGLDFDLTGNLVAVGRTPSQLRVYDESGLLIESRSFLNGQIGSAVDVKVGPDDKYYVATQHDLQEFGFDGSTLRQFDEATYQGVAVVPGGILWGSGLLSDRTIQRFDIETGQRLDPILLENGVPRPSTMRYSALSNTVLLGAEDEVRERALDGTLLRTLTADGFVNTNGVTRGPGGDIFATETTANMVFRWSANGDFIGALPLAGIDGAANIIWAGTIPTPGPLVLLTLSLWYGPRRRRRA